jgi:hypothetical protein
VTCLDPLHNYILNGTHLIYTCDWYRSKYCSPVHKYIYLAGFIRFNMFFSSLYFSIFHGKLPLTPKNLSLLDIIINTDIFDMKRISAINSHAVEPITASHT